MTSRSGVQERLYLAFDPGLESPQALAAPAVQVGQGQERQRMDVEGMRERRDFFEGRTLETALERAHVGPPRDFREVLLREPPGLARLTQGLPEILECGRGSHGLHLASATPKELHSIGCISFWRSERKPPATRIPRIRVRLNGQAGEQMRHRDE